MKTIAIDELSGFLIGQAQDLTAMTGCTVMICSNGAVSGVDVRGGSPGTRDTDALNPINNRSCVHAVLFSGGSSFGMDAAGGVMRCLEQRKIGRDVGVAVVPNVCAAIIFDLNCGDHRVRPDEKMGYEACKNAFSGQKWISGNYGAGSGATLGTAAGIMTAMKGGIGSAALRHDSLFVGAVVAVNCVGDVVDSRTGKIIAGARKADNSGFLNSELYTVETYLNKADFYSGNTLLACIMTNADLNKAQATKLASLGQNGIARCLRPAHTMYDGDTVFTMCTGDVPATLDSVGVLASLSVERAILDAVNSAQSFGHYQSVSNLRFSCEN